VVLLITLVILVILSTLGYTLSVQVATRRHRDRFIIDYAQSQYACTSAMKYALASLADLQPQLVSHPNEPDFSDIFAMTEAQYQELLAEVTAGLTGEEGPFNETNRNRRAASTDVNDANDTDDALTTISTASVTIPGPYGPRWPLVTAPLEFEIGSARVTVEVEDENAKYPLGWALIQDEKLQAQANAGCVTFCEAAEKPWGRGPRSGPSTSSARPCRSRRRRRRRVCEAGSRGPGPRTRSQRCSVRPAPP